MDQPSNHDSSPSPLLAIRAFLGVDELIMALGYIPWVGMEFGSPTFYAPIENRNYHEVMRTGV